ncbi:hypothetical protein B0H14DRAFT_3862677 [Mycena olivaceomarginata]|nr:hypothetical protein B0H14DRAFT_3862677 [Mycena olivaceomarginata]
MLGTISPRQLSAQRKTIPRGSHDGEAYNARTKAQTLALLDSASTTSENDTLGDHITFDKFEKILVANLPSWT